MTVLLLADHDNFKLNAVTSKALGGALAIGGPVHVLVAGSGCQEVVRAARKLEGVEKVLVADAEAYEHALAEPLATLIVGLAGAYDTIVGSSTSTSKNVMPRVAATLDVMQVSEVTKILAPDTFERPVFAGNAIQTVRTTDATKVITLRTTCFNAVGDNGEAPVEAVNAVDGPRPSAFKDQILSKTDRPDLTSARIIVSGGRALQSADNFATYIGPVATRLNAAVGASRAAVDAGYAPNDWQVGQTGKIVAPELYIAVGISGAIQHLAGMKDSKVIVAINSDGEAPIFEVADYGLVGDLFQVLPELEKALG